MDTCSSCARTSWWHLCGWNLRLKFWYFDLRMQITKSNKVKINETSITLHVTCYKEKAFVAKIHIGHAQVKMQGLAQTSEDVVLVVMICLGTHFNKTAQTLWDDKFWNQVLVILYNTKQTIEKETRLRASPSDTRLFPETTLRHGSLSSNHLPENLHFPIS